MWIVARRKKWPVLIWICGCLFAAFSLVAVGGIAAGAHGLYRSSSPRLVFEDTFRRLPPPGTKVLHGNSGGFADSAGIDLSFQTDRAVFDALRPKTMEPGTIEEYRRLNIYKKKWWRNPTAATEIWILDRTYSATDGRPPSGQTFGSELTIMTWDADGLVQYHWSGID
jgi:hypothetical protein